jgi:predicted ATPase/class 3 adenylate cyclase
MQPHDHQVRGFGALASRLGNGLPISESAHGAVLFADLAGFTALGEALAGSGAPGSESLHAVVNGYFEILINRLAAAGGEVTTFAGDALVAVFDGRGQQPQGLAERVLGCAVGMQNVLSAFSRQQKTPVGIHSHMKVGLGSGSFTRALVGQRDLWVLHVLAGVALDRAVAAQRQCRRGEVLVDAALIAALPSIQHTSTRAGWCVLQADSVVDTAESRAYREERPPLFASEAVNTARSSPAPNLLDEHRLVTTVFLALPDMEMPRDGGAKLQAYLTTCMPIIRRYGGDLRQVDAGDKGYQLVMGFGAPRTSADDTERAVACCLELVALPGAPARAGVATGLAFCAEVGTSARREYAVIGDSVNVAARLAQTATPGHVWVDSATAARCATFAEQQRLPALRVGGRTAPVEAYLVSGLRDSPTPTVPAPAPGPEGFVGRAHELARALAAWESAAHGLGKVLLVTGEPGVGKTRLVAQLTAGITGPAAGRMRGVVATGSGGVPGDRRPYLAWRSIWRSILFTPLRSAAEPSEVEAMLSEAGEDERAPLLGAVLGIPIPDNAFTTSLTPAQRADATRAVILDCLRRSCARSPVALVVDDGQWLDELSQDLLTHLAVNISDLPVLIVVVVRDEPGMAPLLARLRRSASVISLPLEGLPPVDATELVRVRAHRQRPALPSELVGRIAHRSGGNPLFLEQLVSWAGEHPEALDTEQLPDFPADVRRLVLARVDRLLPEGQATLKAASVIADDFSASSVHACLPGIGIRQVKRELHQLIVLGLITSGPGGVAEMAYGFRHALVQEVVYGSLSSATRSELHEAVAVHLEQSHADDLQTWVDQLAHHYGHSANVSKQRTWFRAAADAAAGAYANESALQYYRRLLGLLSEAEKPQILVRIGAIHQMTGQWRDGEQVLITALREASALHDRHTAAQAERELGLVLLPTRRFAEAVERLRSAASAFASLGDRAGQAGALDRLAYALVEHGDYRAALDAAREQLTVVAPDLSGNVEQSHQDPAGLAAAFENLGLVRWRCGEHTEAMALLRRAYALARRSGDQRLVVHTANDLAGLCAERGDHRTTVRHLREAIAIADHIGYREATAYLTANAGELYRLHGDFDEAERHFAAGLRSALEVGDWLTTVFCLASLATTASDQGAPGHRLLLRRAGRIAGQLHQSHVRANLLLREAEATFDGGDWPIALALVQQAEAAARRLSEHGPTLRPHLLRLQIEVATGATPVRKACEEVASMLPDWPDPPDRVLLLDTLAAIDPSARSYGLEAAELYRELYVKSASRQYAKAYARLTGHLESLPVARALPRLAEHVSAETVDIDALFTRAEEFAAAAPLRE